MLSLVLCLLLSLEASSVSLGRRSTALLINPAGLGINPGGEWLYFYEEGFNRHTLGLMMGSSGFKGEFKKGLKPCYTMGSGFKAGEKLYLGYTYRFYGSNRWDLGAVFRPHKYISLGLLTPIKSEPTLRGGIAVRPGTDRVTMFFDAAYKDSIQDYWFGAGIEPLDGVILYAKGDRAFLDNRDEGKLQFGLEISFGKLKLNGECDDDFKNPNLLVIASEEKYPTFIPESKKLVTLTLEDSYPEMKEKTEFLGLHRTKTPAFYNLLNKLKTVRESEDAVGIFIHFKPYGLGIAQTEELRHELLEFKKAGKKIITFSDYYGFGKYYLASLADYRILTPLGEVTIPGLMARRFYIKGTLEKLGIETDIERVGEYKSAVELFEREDMSEEEKEQIGAYLDDIWNPMINEIAESKGMSPEKVKTLINEGVYFNSDAAIDSGLVDELAYWWEIDHVLEGFWDKKVKREPIDKFLDKKEVPRTWSEENRDKIAILIAEGSIVIGESGYDPTPFIGGKYMGSETISKLLDQIKKDKSIKALVFRVNSGGGSALASEIIAQALKRVAKEKPVVVSMSNVAGSGGYYISCFGDKILADRFTLTGSIGVLGIYVIMKGLYDKLGISWDKVQRGEHADMESGLRHLTPEERESFKEQIEWYYDKFISRVAEKRPLTKTQVDSIGRGRIWSGIRAKEIGLIDEIGGLLQAIELAKEEAGIKRKAEIVIFPTPKKEFSFDLNPGFWLPQVIPALPVDIWQF